MRKDLIQDKTFKFAKRILRLFKYLSTEKKEYIISKQILRSGTSIGANVREAKYAQSDKDFISKLSIALKETSETEYWLELMRDEYLTDIEVDAIIPDLIEIIKILTSSINTMKDKMKP